MARRLGATGLESDVWITADGMAVLDHDGVVRRGVRRVPIARVDRADLPAHIPTLEEFYAACGTDLDVSLDVKDPDAYDAVADVVDTGTTLRQAGLFLLGEPILTSEAIVVRPEGAPADTAVGTFLRRLQGVMTARTYVLVDYDVPNDLVERACALTPGLESPTVAALHETGWSAVRAVVPKADVHGIMDDLADLGGRGILVTSIMACRL